ncbi:hypothetical protein ACFLQQ_04010 [Actinomycetota bacterium]
MNRGWISVHRKILDSPLWVQGTLTQKLMMIILVMLASTGDKKIIFDGKEKTLHRGQLLTSIDSLVNIMGKGSSIQKVRTALSNLKKYGFLTDKATKRGRVISIVNYRVYQGPLRLVNRQTNKDLTVSNNINKRNKNKSIKDVKNVKKYSERDYGRDYRKRSENKFFGKEV